jgi:hypothetical protein
VLRVLIEVVLFLAVGALIEWLVLAVRSGWVDADGQPKKSGFDDPIYKENVRKLIERNRGFKNQNEQA